MKPLLSLPLLTILAAAGLAAMHAPSLTARPVEQVTRLETLTGPAAIAYLQAKIAATSAIANAYAVSGAQLRSRGYKQTDQVVVLRRYRPVANARKTPSAFERLARGFAPSLVAQTVSESNEEGEVIFTSWDDGDDGTWEGEQFFQDYSDGYWELTNLQEDINEHPLVLWARLAGSRDGRERERGDLNPASFLPGNSAAGQFEAQVCEPSVRSALFVSTEASPFRLSPVTMAQLWVSCNCSCEDSLQNRLCIQAEIAACHAKMCGSALWQCRRSGPGYKLCLVVRCGGAAVVCAGDANRCYRKKCSY